MSQPSGSYPTFTYRMTTIAAGSDTLKLNFTSDEIIKNDCWTQDISIANNKRITYLEVKPSEYSQSVTINKYSQTEFNWKPEVKTNGEIPSDDIQFEYKADGHNKHANVKSLTLNGNILTIACSGYKVVGQTHKSYFFIYSNNGINGAKVISNELTLEVH